MNLDDKYDIYSEEDFFDLGREARRQKKQRKARKAKSAAVEPDALTDFDDSAEGFVPSYVAHLDPQHHERTWVTNSVVPFYRDEVITDVVSMVKGGKEANVYVCLGHPATGFEYVAAKLYRPRELRHLRNDAIYKAGRQLRDEEGKEMKGRRVKLAMRKKTNFGKHVDIMWWIGNEFSTQKALYEAGADVPKPLGHQGNTILMAFVGDAYGAAPLLSQIRIERDEAQPLFDRLLDNIQLMLDNHFIHGDLSPYNILYWEGEPTIIDFPQVVDARTNPYAFDLLLRDVTRVAAYFERYGISAEANDIAAEMWHGYMGPG